MNARYPCRHTLNIKSMLIVFQWMKRFSAILMLRVSICSALINSLILTVPYIDQHKPCKNITGHIRV